MKINKDKARKLLQNLSNFDSGITDVYESVDKELKDVSEKLKKSVELKTISEVNEQFKKLEKLFKPLIPKFEELQSTLTENDKKLISQLKERFSDIESTIKSTVDTFNDNLRVRDEKISNRIKAVEDKKIEIPDFTPQIKSLDKKFTEKFDGIKIPTYTKEIEAVDKKVEGVKISVEQLRDKRGGSAHLQVNVNSSVASNYYADINFVSDTAIRWSATNDTTNKRVNLQASLISGGAGGGGSLTVKEADGAPNVSSVTTIVVSNGTLTDDGSGQVTISTGGGGSGISRISSTISVSSVFANASQTDYVAFANVGIALTLPVASSGNLYTVKNMSGSSVLVLAGEGIEEGASALISNNYESLSFISNSSIWAVV